MSFIWRDGMSKRTAQTDRPIRIIGASEGAKAPPASAVRKGLAALRQSIAEREQKRSRLMIEQTKLRQKLYAPIIGSIKSDAGAKDAIKALKKSQGVILRTEKIPRLTPVPQLAFDQIATSENSFMIVEPYAPFNAEHHYRSQAATSDSAGNLGASINPDDGSAWVWAGVGFPVVPGRNCMARVTPIMFYRYAFGAFGNLGVTAHCEGALGVHLHRYDSDWQDTGEMEDFRTGIWSHTTETSIIRPDPGTTVFDQSSLLFLRGDSNYLVWATLELSGNCSSGVFFLV
jgi:hypothetical protein